MTAVTFYDSIESARMSLDVANPELRFGDAIRAVNLNDAQQVVSFLEPQLLTVNQTVYMIKRPAYDYANFMPVDTSGDIWSAGSLFYSGDISGKAEWFSAAADDMPYADFSKSQFIQENHMAAIGYKFNRGDLARGQQLGVDVLSQKAAAASGVAEKFLHEVAMTGDGTKFATGFINNPDVTVVAAGATLAAGTADDAVATVNAALTSIEVNTGETFLATDLALPIAVYNGLASRRMTDTNMTVLSYIQANSVVPNLRITKTRHLTTTMVAYANTLEVHRFHSPGGGHQFFPMREIGAFSWEVAGAMNTGGYECRIPKAFTRYTGIA